MNSRRMRLPDGAYCPMCGKWVPNAYNVREDWEEEEQSTVIECENCELEIVAYIDPLKREGE